MMQRLRREIRDSFLPFAGGMVHPPALRRFRGLEALLSTDVPALLPPETYRTWRERLGLAGWKVGESGGWAHLDPLWALRAQQCQADSLHLGIQCFPHAAQEMELLASLSILTRHGRSDVSLTPDDLMMIRAMYHAVEGDGNAWRRACAALHRGLAVRLRKREKVSVEMLYLISALVLERDIPDESSV